MSELLNSGGGSNTSLFCYYHPNVRKTINYNAKRYSESTSFKFFCQVCDDISRRNVLIEKIKNNVRHRID